jgi:hypothetical protein
MIKKNEHDFLLLSTQVKFAHNFDTAAQVRYTLTCMHTLIHSHTSMIHNTTHAHTHAHTGLMIYTYAHRLYETTITHTHTSGRSPYLVVHSLQGAEDFAHPHLFVDILLCVGQLFNPVTARMGTCVCVRVCVYCTAT